MAYRATVEVEDHEDVGVCTTYYEKMLRLSGVVDWTPLTPYDNSPTIVVNGLLGGQTYELKVRRYGCNSEYSPETIIEIETP